MRTGRWGELLPERGFSRRQMPADIEAATRGSAWVTSFGVQVISSCVDAELPGTDGQTGPSWHLSVTVNHWRTGLRRPVTNEMWEAIDSFGLPAWEEDNHHPGAARHLWCPINPAYRGVCECKLTEVTVTEPDGYQWTTPTDGPCRGCEHARMFPGRRCTIHEKTER
jgi:hypothetical protein